MTAKKPNRRDVAKAATRAKLIKAARDLWSEPGTYERIGIREIAAGAGVSTGAIFANWSGKEALWREAMGYEPPVDCAVVREALRREARALPAGYRVAA